MSSYPIRFLAVLAAAATLHADTDKLSMEQKIELLRGLQSEYALAKVVLPRSRKALKFYENGTWDQKGWDEANYKMGPAARPGDMVQITGIDIDDDKITIELNDGTPKQSFWDRIQIGTGNQTVPLSSGRTNAAAGTSIEVRFDRSIEGVDSERVKEILATILDFDQRTATEQYVETLPEPVQAAIKEERAIEGMDSEQVILALGRPVRKVRETKDDIEYEDWIYGAPPGVVTFVTFANGEVVEVQEMYAGLTGNVVDIPGPDSR